jgi:1,4-dihydroxy-6-naphthoate synthase
MVVSRELADVDALRKQVIAVPGTLTSAFLALRLYLGQDFEHVVVPFDEIIVAVERGYYNDRPVNAGLIIHEGQLTYANHHLKLLIDLGVWWKELTGLPLPLGANGIRRDLGEKVIRDVQKLLRSSIKFGLDHRQEALDHALQYGRDLDRSQADKFVGMYVNDWTLDFGTRGREAVRRFLAMGHEAGVLPKLVTPQFVEL